MGSGPRLRSSAVCVVMILLVGCSPSPTAAPSLVVPSQVPVPISTPSPSIVPPPSPSLPPASATVSFGGDVKGLAKGIQVNCQIPSADGLLITLFGATTTKDVASTITIGPASVLVTIDSGSGATFSAREFTGGGVTGFDPTKGAQVDTPLVEVTSTSKPGSLPAITSIKGSVDCGNQVPGSSTLTVTGHIGEGPISGPIDPIRVDCNPNAKPATVHAIGLIKVASAEAVVVFQATANGYTAYVVATLTTVQHFFMTSDPTAATISPTGAHVSGSAAETDTANTIQVSGDLVCGVINP
jgi:hypothetical protein